MTLGQFTKFNQNWPCYWENPCFLLSILGWIWTANLVTVCFCKIMFLLLCHAISFLGLPWKLCFVLGRMFECSYTYCNLRIYIYTYESSAKGPWKGFPLRRTLGMYVIVSAKVFFSEMAISLSLEFWRKNMYTYTYIVSSAYIQKHVLQERGMAMAARNTLTCVRPMISGFWAFCESTIYRLFCKKQI